MTETHAAIGETADRLAVLMTLADVDEAEGKVSAEVHRYLSSISPQLTETGYPHLRLELLEQFKRRVSGGHLADKIAAAIEGHSSQR